MLLGETKAYSYLLLTLGFERWREISRTPRSCWKERDVKSLATKPVCPVCISLFTKENPTSPLANEYGHSEVGVLMKKKKNYFAVFKTERQTVYLERYWFLTAHTYQRPIKVLADSNTVFSIYAYIYFLSLITSEVYKWPLFLLATNKEKKKTNHFLGKAWKVKDQVPFSYFQPYSMCLEYLRYNTRKRGSFLFEIEIYFRSKEQPGCVFGLIFLPKHSSHRILSLNCFNAISD